MRRPGPRGLPGLDLEVGPGRGVRGRDGGRERGRFPATAQGEEDVREIPCEPRKGIEADRELRSERGYANVPALPRSVHKHSGPVPRLRDLPALLPGAP